MTDPRSHAELERRILAGLLHGSTYVEASTALSELCRRLREAEADRERLDWLTEQTRGYGNGWICRESVMGRGMRLHEDASPYAVGTPREAIDSARREPRDD